MYHLRTLSDEHHQASGSTSSISSMLINRITCTAGPSALPGHLFSIGGGVRIACGGGRCAEAPQPCLLNYK
jgi:hypothetical protein